MDELDIFDPFKKIRKQETSLSKFFDSNMEFDSFIRSPLLDIKDEGDKLKIIAELPGIKKQDLDIDLTANQLTLKAKADVKKEEKSKKKGYYSKERKFNSFFRSIKLPEEIIPDKTRAEFKNGVLELHLKKKQGKKQKGFKVKVR